MPFETGFLCTNPFQQNNNKWPTLIERPAPWKLIDQFDFIGFVPWPMHPSPRETVKAIANYVGTFQSDRHIARRVYADRGGK